MLMWKDIRNKIIIMNKYFPNQPKEIETGNIEYKWKIFPNIDNKKNRQENKFNKLNWKYNEENNKNINFKCNKLATQMNWRCYEGNGRSIYILGIRDDGIAVGINKLEMYKTLLFIIRAANIIKASINKIRLYKGINGSIATIRISSKIEEEDDGIL